MKISLLIEETLVIAHRECEALDVQLETLFFKQQNLARQLRQEAGALRFIRKRAQVTLRQ